MPISSRDNDEVVEEILRLEGHAEALAWLSNDLRDMIREEKSDHVRMVKAFYAAGAREVLVTQFSTVDGITYAQTLVVGLPDDQGRRAAVLQCGADLLWDGVRQPAERMKHFGFTDTGQKYIEWNTL